MKFTFNLSLLQGRWAISLKAWLLLAIPAIIYNFNSQRDHVQGKVLLALLAITFSELLVGGLFYLADQSWLKKRATEQQPISKAIATWSLAGLTRSTSNVALFQLFSIPISRPITHILLSIVVAPLVYGPFLYFLALNDSIKRHFIELEVERELLRKHNKDLSLVLSEERERLMKSIQDLIVPGLEKLQTDLSEFSSDIYAQATKLREVSAEISSKTSSLVRKLSHDLQNQSPKEESELDSSHIFSNFRKITLFELFQYVEVPFALPIGLILITGSVVQGQLHGWRGLLIFWIVSLEVAVLLLLARAAKSLQLITTPIANFIGLIFLSLGTGIASLFFGRFLKNQMFNGENLFSPYTAGLWIALGIFVSTLIHSRLEEIATYSEFIEEHKAKLQSVMKEQREASTAVRNQLSSALHGPVLGRLSAASMALRLQTPDAEHRALLLLLEAKADIENLLRPEPTTESPELSAHLEQAKAQWAGLIELSWVIEPKFEIELKTAASVNRMVQEVVNEAISNASRHGQAKNLDFSFYIRDQFWIVQAIDDGTGPVTEVIPGLGSAIATRNYGTWSVIASERGGAIAEIALPRML